MTILASSEKYMDKNESMVSISSKYYLSLETLASITKLPCFKKAVFHLKKVVLVFIFTFFGPFQRLV